MSLASQANERIPAEQVRARVDEVLQRGEFQWDRKSLGERLLDWLADTFDLPSLPASLSGLEWVLAVPLAVLAVWLGVKLARVLRAAAVEQSAERIADSNLLAARVAAALEGARTAREAGDRTLALRLYFLALVLGLGGRGDLDYRDTWTNRELLERGQPSPQAAAVLAPLVADLDAQVFGGAPTSDADVDYLADLCARWLSAAGAAA